MRKDILNAIIQMKEVKDLVNKSEIARRFDCSYNTVTKYMNSTQKVDNTRKYSSKLDNFKGIIIDKVDNYGANARGIFNFITDKGYSGSYQTVANYIREHKKTENKKAIIRFETSPGLQAQVDWKEDFRLISKSRSRI